MVWGTGATSGQPSPALQQYHHQQNNMHTTNYIDTFIEVATDTKVVQGSAPPLKDKKSAARMQYELIARNPYKYTSDDILFRVYAERNNIHEEEEEQGPDRDQFFSKGQPCLRASALTKTYGFGIHSNSEGKVALYGMETEEYRRFLDNTKIKKVRAMRSGK